MAYFKNQQDKLDAINNWLDGFNNSQDSSKNYSITFKDCRKKVNSARINNGSKITIGVSVQLAPGDYAYASSHVNLKDRIEFLLKKNKTMTPGIIVNRCRNFSKEEVVAVLEAMVFDHDLIKKETRAKNGRGTEYYSLA